MTVREVPGEGSPQHVMHLERMIKLAQLAADLFAQASASEGARMQEQVDSAQIYVTALRVQATRAAQPEPERPSALHHVHPEPRAEQVRPTPPPPPPAPETKSLEQVFDDMSRVFDAVGPLFSALRGLGKK